MRIEFTGEIALRLNAPEASGPRLLPVLGEVVTEIDAITILSGATAELVAGGGVCGTEGSIRLGLKNEKEYESTAAVAI